MTALIVPDDLDAIAEAIVEEHRLVVAHAEGFIAHAMDAGDLLIRAKAKLKHGEWMSWLATNCELTQSTANRYMQAADNREELEANSARVRNLSLRAIPALLAPGKPEPVMEPPRLPAGRFRCLVIDPPWPIEKIERDVRPAQAEWLDYPTMTLDEITALPIADLADEDGCHIYLWVTQRFLPAGLSLFAAWGVRYECVMTWLKPGGMTPFSWMYNTEHVIFGRFGQLPLQRRGLKLGFSAPATGHSVKPDAFYERVIEASPAPRLELFARRQRDGFDVWGNEVTDAMEG